MMSNEPPIRVGVIGCGYWGVNYVRVFGELPGTEVVAICDARADRLQEVGARFPGAALLTDLDQLLVRPEIDAVAVCTGATTHFAVASKSLAAGKHVLVEKPMATTVADAEQLVAQANAAKRTLMVGHTFLYNAGIRKVKRYVEEAEMGQIYCLYARRTNLGPVRHDVNALWDLAPHDLSIFNYLLDDTPQWVSAVGSTVLQNERADVGFISLGYANNVVANIHVSWVDPYKVRELVVVSSQKRIIFDDLNATEQVKVYEKGIQPTIHEASSYGEHQFQVRDGDIHSPRIAANEPLKTLCEHFVTAVIEEQPPLTGAESGLEIVKVLAAIDRSMAQNGAPVVLDPRHAAVPVAAGAAPLLGDHPTHLHANGKHANGHHESGQQKNGHHESGQQKTSQHKNGHHQNGQHEGGQQSVLWGRR